MRLSRLCLWGMLVAGAAALAAAASDLLVPLTGLGDERVMIPLILAGVYFCLALACAVARERRRWPGPMLSGVVVGAAVTACWIGAMWVDEDVLERWLWVLVWPTCWTCLAALLGILALAPPGSRWVATVRRLTLVVLVLLALHVALAFTLYPRGGSGARDPAIDWSRRQEYENAALRSGGALALLAAGGVACTLVGGWLRRGSERGEPAEPRPARPFWLQCPRCAAEQTALTGWWSCERYGLRVRVET
jgi:hypothetical protein